MLLGCGLIFLVGFAPIAAVHNAAHDTRHSAAFPCH
jgi:cobalt transporter subunit CbtB